MQLLNAGSLCECMSYVNGALVQRLMPRLPGLAKSRTIQSVTINLHFWRKTNCRFLCIHFICRSVSMIESSVRTTPMTWVGPVAAPPHQLKLGSHLKRITYAFMPNRIMSTISLRFFPSALIRWNIVFGQYPFRYCFDLFVPAWAYSLSSW